MLLSKKGSKIAVLSAMICSAAIFAASCTNFNTSESTDASSASSDAALSESDSDSLDSEAGENSSDKPAEDSEESGSPDSSDNADGDTESSSVDSQEDSSSSELDSSTQTEDESESDSEADEQNDEESSISDSSTQFESAEQKLQTESRSVYLEIIKEREQLISEEESAFDEELCRYYIADINGDGISEFLAEMGTCEADRTVYVYTSNEQQSEAVELGSFSSWRAALGIEDEILYIESTVMGNYVLSTATIENNELKIERSIETNTESKISSPLKGYSYSDQTGVE